MEPLFIMLKRGSINSKNHYKKSSIITIVAPVVIEQSKRGTIISKAMLVISFTF